MCYGIEVIADLYLEAPVLLNRGYVEAVRLGNVRILSLITDGASVLMPINIEAI